MNIPKPKSEVWAIKVLEGWDCNGFRGGFNNTEAIRLVKLLNWHLATVNLPAEDQFDSTSGFGMPLYSICK